jgi:hypothetical protein
MKYSDSSTGSSDNPRNLLRSGLLIALAVLLCAGCATTRKMWQRVCRACRSDDSSEVSMKPTSAPANTNVARYHSAPNFGKAQDVPHR